ncbi:serine/threonine-protein kinase [Vibrio splendidus]|uniref:serine/threonine-protein kinase n=1 Tax=Vibrio splendidus TaxID=29497 RepID=UPI0011B377A3|nr:serine/threonine-protein kinase [Vibrio splendidus]
MSVANTHITDLFYQLLDLSEVEKTKYLKELKTHQVELYDKIYPFICTSKLEPITRIFGVGALQSTNKKANLSDTYIDKYHLSYEIGRGGIGVVYAATRVDKTFHQNLAIKLIQPTLSHLIDKEYLFHEAQALATLNHPNITKVMDGGTYEGSVYIVMEHIKGCTLNEYLATYSLNKTKKLSLFLKICSAISHAHKHQVLHTDLKPENILIDCEGHPKILDFNLMRGISDQLSAFPITINAYSHDYASPEQINGSPPTVQCDIYALGKILTFMFPKLPISQGDLRCIIQKATRRHALLRYSSTNELYNDIKQIIACRPITAYQDQPFYSALKLCQRRPVQCALSTVLIWCGVGFYTPLIKKSQQLQIEKRASERVTKQFVRTLSLIKESPKSKASINTVLKHTHKAVLGDPGIPTKTKKKLLRIISPRTIRAESTKGNC